MLPELKCKFAFPGFGSIELEGEHAGTETIFREITIKFIPSEPCDDNHGVIIRFLRNGSCIVHEITPITGEDIFEGIGTA